MNNHSPISCPCDEWIHPQPLEIPAGMSTIPRQIATFPEFRKAMMADIRQHYPLNHWNAREADDLGIMLLEMWAYICDSLTFYDEVIAHESYLRTARLRTSLRKLIGLLGYLPRPAVAATVQLAAMADGRQPITLPKGTAFRSGGFDEEAPQIFELDADTAIHPFTNQWDLHYIYPKTVDASRTRHLLVTPEAEIERDTLLMVHHKTNDSNNRALAVDTVETFSGVDGKIYTEVGFTSNINLSSSVRVKDLELLTPTQSTHLWTTTDVGNSVQRGSTNLRLILGQIIREIKSSQYVLVGWKKKLYWAKVKAVGTIQRDAVEPSTMNINGNTFDIPGSQVSVTEVTFDNGADGGALKSALSGVEVGEITVHYAMQFAGKVVREAKEELHSTDSLHFTTEINRPLENHEPKSYLLQDVNTLGVSIGGELDKRKNGITPSDLSKWQNPLFAPVKAFGNVVSASRGESVFNEVLGNGDASLAHQTFKLKKKPLTYLLSASADNDQGVINTLEVYVDNIRWAEVPNFYLSQPEDQVYVVRQDDDEESYVIFGDGKRGQRLPSGMSNVVAHYRFGAGEAAPPSGSISQIAKPVQGLQSVANPVAASGGADAEPSSEMRENAPDSALILGRAVSIHDMEAVALAIPGVRVVQAQWRWEGTQQRPVVHVWYIGENNIEGTITERLRNVSDPSTPFEVKQATAIPVALHIDVEGDARYAKEPLLEAIQEQLMDAKSGFLIPENVGIGRPFYRSGLYEAILAIEGTTCVKQVNWNRGPLTVFAKSPGAGRYFDFEAKVTIGNY